MNDTSLRSSLIRLAHTHPEFRKDLLPLLKGASSSKKARGGMSVGELIRELSRYDDDLPVYVGEDVVSEVRHDMYRSPYDQDGDYPIVTIVTDR